MENKSKKCNSCGRFPFCEITQGPKYTCDKHIKREVERKLVYKNGEIFDFERIE